MNTDLRAEVKKTYQRIAKEFDVSRSRHAKEFEEFLRFIPQGTKLLDLGCGNGRLLGFLEHRDWIVNYTGVDFCSELLFLAKKKYPKAAFVEQDMAELQLNERFERIMCFSAFHHLPSTKLRKKALKKMFDHLSDHGLLILSVWNLWQWRYWKSWLRGFFSRDLFIPFGKEKITRYYHAFLPFELRGLLKDEGFEIEEERSSHHNFLFICRKKVFVAPMNPLFVAQKDFVPSSPA